MARLLASIATRTPMAPATSSSAPLSSTLRVLADTAIWPPLATVVEPPAKVARLPVTISMRDRSPRSLTVLRLSNTPPVLLTMPPSSALMAASRWPSRPVTADASSSTAVTLPAPSVMLPVASPARFSRWMAPRAPMSVVASSTPSWRTVRPVSVMSPVGALIRPVLPTRPALLPALIAVEISLPWVVERRLTSVP